MAESATVLTAAATRGGYGASSVSFVGNHSNPACYDFYNFEYQPDLHIFIPTSATASAAVAMQAFTMATA